MANVRKITHPPRRDGSVKTSWRATCAGPDGVRQSKNFDRKGDATAWLAQIGSGALGGSPTMTVADLARAHIAYFDGLVKIGKRQAVTRDGYQTILDLHVCGDAEFARTRLSKLRTPDAQAFLDRVLARTGSTNLARSVRRALVTWCKFGMRRGWLAANPAQACGVERESTTRDEEASFVLPGKETLGALLAAAAEGDHAARDTAIVRLLMFAGLRISELLGLADDAVETRSRAGKVRVRERLDRHYRTLDPPKSKKGRRDVPIGDAGALAVRAWRLARGPVMAFDHVDGRRQRVRAAGRLFPDPATGQGVWDYNGFFRDCWQPLMKRAGLSRMLPDSKGKNRPVIDFGPHMLRHVAASLWIAQDVKPKKLQELLGHSTLQMTMDLYGHLWTDPEADDAIGQGSERLIG